MFKKYNNNNDRAWSGLFGLILLVGILVYFKFHVAENNGEEYTLPHVDWTPDSKEDTVTYLDEDVMWIGNNGDTIWE